ncbi:hypothetical protein EIP91_005539 [Steccherinum ochraceum]|uniref:Glucose receptor Git3 N-terminal domain-containing protein n=1 Tax=Steccherinum ochraceum TaxID=92696 RepID=A0A4R0RMF7_9APHY|nr:hypothetical protein EIP91_005539 [Steccherinum ochraceum]
MASSANNATSCPTPTVFPFSVRIGLIFVSQAAGLSAAAIICLLCYIVYSAVRAIGTSPNIRVFAMKRVLKQLGDVGVALASLAIAIHTFSVIVLGWRPQPKSTMAMIVLGGIWIFLILIATISVATHRGKDYYGDTQYWCWITSDYPAQRIALEYAWMWTAAFTNLVLYIPITLVLKGFISAQGGRLKVLRRSDSIRSMDVNDSNQAIDHLATKMLWYPAVYTCTVLPIAIVRWDAFLGHCIPWGATVASDFIFACSGLLNVLLFSVTRPALVPHRTTANFGTGIRSATPFSTSPPALAERGTFSSSRSWGSPSPTQPVELAVRTDSSTVVNVSTPNVHIQFDSEFE